MMFGVTDAYLSGPTPYKYLDLNVLRFPNPERLP